MRIALFLLVLGFGYRIFIDASRQKIKGFQSLGQSVGVFMMVVSLFGCLYFIASGLKYLCVQKGNCPVMSKGKWMQNCPFSGRSQEGRGEILMAPRPPEER